MDYSTEFFLVLISLGLIMSFLMEGWLQSRPLLFWKRGWACNTVHIGLYFLGLGVMLLLIQRVTIAVLLLFLAQLIIVAVSNTKEKTLREPFLHCDFEYFSDAIKHPRLYLPFFGYAKAAFLILGGIFLFGVLLYVSRPITEIYDSFALVVAAELLLITLSALTIGIAGKRLPVMTLEPLNDMRRCGLLSFLYGYRSLEKCTRIQGKTPFERSRSDSISLNQKPDLVSIQAESFFDPRHSFSCLRNDLLPHWDRLCRESISSGPLDTGPWGANTVRPEFEFLTGLSSSQIGVHQFQPYRTLGLQPLPTITTWLKSLGYRTIAIHPYEKCFYNRDKIYPNLGFDEFIDISHFKDAALAGGYVSDIALGEFVADMLAQPCSQPRYLHVVTMENHGPYDITSGLENTQNPLSREIPERCAELEVYARHLQNTDALLGLVANALSAQDSPGALCVFGDHVPILSHAYEALGYPDGHTNYLIWNAVDKKYTATKTALSVEHLAQTFLTVVGMPSPAQPTSA
jgi:Sulfatase